MSEATIGLCRSEFALRRRAWSGRIAAGLIFLAIPIVGGCSPTTTPIVPTITSTTDVTGGVLVVGDLLDVAGTNLSKVSEVMVDGKPASIITVTDTSLRIQIPKGVRNGQDTLTLQYATSGGTAEVTTSLEVHRLAVFVGTLNNKIVVADTTDQSIVKSFDVTTIGSDYPLVPATLNNGSLGLVATGRGLLYWVDLTANPPSMGSLDLGGSQLLGVAVSFGEDMAAVYDLGAGNAAQGDVFAVSVQQGQPPYTSPIAAGGPKLPMPRPHGSTFFSSGFLAVPLEDLNELAVVQRSGSTLTDTFARVDAGNILFPTMSRLVPDGTKMLVPSWTDGQIRLYSVSGGGLAFASFVQLASMEQAVALDVDPTGAFAYVIDYSNSRVVPIQIVGTTMTLLTPGPAPPSPILRCIAVDPVEGKYLYVGKDTASFVDIYDISAGSTLTLRAGSNPLAGDTDLAGTNGIVIQP